MVTSNPYLDAFSALSVSPVFSQPILPGWTINVNSNNSSSPRTEGLVVSKFSYGHQIGVISDALAAIIETLPATLQSDKAVAKFVKMKKAVDVLKAAI